VAIPMELAFVCKSARWGRARERLATLSQTTNPGPELW